MSRAKFEWVKKSKILRATGALSCVRCVEHMTFEVVQLRFGNDPELGGRFPLIVLFLADVEQVVPLAGCFFANRNRLSGLDMDQRV